MEFRRADGVRIQHDPTDPRIVAKYGQPGRTDDEGFDPYSDTVGPGIYGAHSADRRTQQCRSVATLRDWNPRARNRLLRSALTFIALCPVPPPFSDALGGTCRRHREARRTRTSRHRAAIPVA